MGDSAALLPDTTPQMSGPALEIVVAHYNEDLSWLLPVAPEVTLYVKGNSPEQGHIFRQVIRLPNIGRESHTFLHHIVSRYDTLSDITLFVQGSVNGPACYREHSKMTITDMRNKALKSEVGDFTIFGSEADGTFRSFDQWDGFDRVSDPDNLLWLEKQAGDFLFADCTPGQLWLDTFGYEPPPSIMFAEGAFFAVRAETVRLRPKQFYEKLLGRFIRANHVNPEIGHFVEKFWLEVFTGVKPT